MRELWIWRGIATVACIGWLTTALWTGPDATAPAPTAGGAAELNPAERLRRSPDGAGEFRADRMNDLQERLRARQTTQASPPTSEDAVAEAAMDAARAEVQAEMHARREAHAEERLSRMLDRATTFAEANELDDAALQALSDAVLANHQRMLELRPPDAFGPRGDGPPEGHREKMQASFDQFDADLREALGDTLAEEFQASMRPERGPPP